MVVKGLTFLAGVYGAYKGHQHQERMQHALDEQTGVLKEQLEVIRSGTGSDPRRGQTIDEMA